MPHLYIVAGHGAGDPGACAGGQSEADLVRQLAWRIKELGGDYVTVGNTEEDWYQSGRFGWESIPDDWAVCELHMDSAGPGARGGHIIINGAFEPDAFDCALADGIAEFFPGRSVAVARRGDLANCNTCANRGINYRLVENGFISYDGDRSKFINQMDDLARVYLHAAGITTDPEPEYVPPREVHIWETNGTDAQKWWMRDNGDGTVSFRNASSWEWLSVPNSVYANGTRLECWGGLDGTDEPKPCQRFVLVLKTNCEYTKLVEIVPADADGMAVDVEAGSIGKGAAVQLYERNGSHAQEWVLYQLEDKSYRVVNTGSWKLLDQVNGGK